MYVNVYISAYYFRLSIKELYKIQLTGVPCFLPIQPPKCYHRQERCTVFWTDIL